MKNFEFIDNAKVIDINELPKIGDNHEWIKGLICIEVKIIAFTDDYIIYQAKFCEKNSLHMLDDFFIDCSSWSYAVKKFEVRC